MTTNTAEGTFDESRRGPLITGGKSDVAVPKTGQWFGRLAKRLDLSTFDVWMIVLTIASIGFLFLTGEVVSRLSR